MSDMNRAKAAAPVRLAIGFAAWLVAVCGCSTAGLAQISQEAPEGPGGAPSAAQKTGAVGHSFMISSANPLASKAGYDILAKGGSAVDAAIAAQLVLNLVEPQSSGIGGGGFMLYYNAAKNKLTSFDGRERAPKAATPDLFLDGEGQFIGWMNALTGGRSTGVPGILSLLKKAHDKYGKLPWADLFQPAIELADNGFVVSPRLSTMLTRFTKYMTPYEDARAYFYPDGKPLQAGTVLKNPAFAQTLRLIAAQGTAPFYKGALGQEITQRLHKAIESSAFPDYAGMSAKDLSAYKAVERAPVCGPYRGYKVCGMAPPSSGGITILQILGMLDQFDLSPPKTPMVTALHLFAEAQRRAFADRDYYLGDPDFVAVPQKALLDRVYLSARAGTIDPLKVTTRTALPGILPGLPHPRLAPKSREGDNTSHLSVVDADGNGVSFTTSIETAFGSRLMVGGFLLNNQLTDFEFQPLENGRPKANAPGPGKRPLSSMSPTMVFRPDGSLYMLIGSPGGKRIISYVAKTIIAKIDWDMSLQEAIDFPHVVNTNGATGLENASPVRELAGQLEKMGHEVRVQDMSSGLHGILITKDGIIGAADPRREGVALGE